MRGGVWRGEGSGLLDNFTKDHGDVQPIGNGTMMSTGTTYESFVQSFPPPSGNLTTAQVSQFETLVNLLVQRTIDPCKKALDDAGLKLSDIKEVTLVGGMSRTPKVIDTVKNVFSREPNKGINHGEVVAVGAAI